MKLNLCKIRTHAFDSVLKFQQTRENYSPFFSFLSSLWGILTRTVRQKDFCARYTETSVIIKNQNYLCVENYLIPPTIKKK